MTWTIITTAEAISMGIYVFMWLAGMASCLFIIRPITMRFAPIAGVLMALLSPALWVMQTGNVMFIVLSATGLVLSIAVLLLDSFMLLKGKQNEAASGAFRRW